MSRPRKPFGNNLPGRLPATMIKVLAAEMSDQGRLARGKRYHADSAVIDIVVGHGAVTAEIQGSRPQPYVVTIEATSGTGVPGRREVVARCTCPDDGLYEACKHAVAALFALSDEIAIEPELLARWRRSPTPAQQTAPADAGGAEVIPLRPDVRHRPVPDRGAALDRVPVDPPRTPAPGDPTLDEIARLLAAPGGARTPPLPDPEPITHPTIGDRMLAEVLADALAHLRLQWD